VLQQRVVERLPLLLGELGEGSVAGGVVRHTGELQGLAHLVGGWEPFFDFAVSVVAVDFERDAGEALRKGVVVSAFGMGVGGWGLLGDVVGEFCDLCELALSHRRFSSAGVIPHCHPSLQQSKRDY